MADPASAVHESHEVIAGRPNAKMLLSCEHASERLPERWRWPEADRRLLGTHWAVDLGARAFAIELAERTGSPAVLARFSRLLIDPNRELDSSTLLRDWAEGAPVELNCDVAAADRQRRIDEYYRPYHQAFDELVQASPQADFIFSVHSFTPMYEGTPRDIEVGILYDSQAQLGEQCVLELGRFGYDVRVNQPWSGLGGLMYSAEDKAQRHGRRALELEIRQDLAVQPRWRHEFADRLVLAFERMGLL